MKRVFKWTAIGISAGVATAVAYKVISAGRRRLEQGLERVERIAEDARDAVARTQEALGQTAATVREVRQTIS